MAEQSTQEQADHTSTVAKHYNELQESGLEKRKESRIFHLRNFNNWMKSVLIGETIQTVCRQSQERVDLSVLDICCGKGGDLLKWKKGQISKIVCADIAETSVEQCHSRYQEMVDRARNDRGPNRIFSAEFIAADCTKKRLKDMYKDSNMSFDIASCQFSFHYCFESYPQAKLMLQNACECLKLGGYFIGTTPDSYEIVRRFRDSPDHRAGNDVYSVTFCGEDVDNIPLFGAKYDFHLEGVVDCPEFLVYFPVLEKMAEEFGMKLVYRKPFDEYFAEKSEMGEHRALLGRMSALECYPPPEGTALVGNCPEDYKDTEIGLNKLKDEDARPEDLKRHRPARVGTLSQAEWDASTIYLAFAFQKVKDINTGKLWTEPNSKERSRKRHSDQHTDTAECSDKQQKTS
ncbi:mRNA cap guanine-N7 methyltransferase-like [Mizuhopecten yessoensis]|uniref:mRNA cap guanine-N(7) methyltransferase n=1 Tax=Mizuhopecten yessoensis TaxID=6573 RepID=A0A210R621_MIZYE|nr:mRNA cap guanine-N7 methyltransferase-like [Mizuhopecten yessoensis]XP_021348138.1 mRNA cap guanine-N7 methyltransferase-like [Mizuhopecten yessoensis]XP_021348145.1 mRNA cap guanine-N7 methyltransferase-like [Mizuhopecten yessoensis]OWF56493.1 mRNA cap guanine-N7 methyltransferase [Mizuhopecten yessoensis]